MSPLFRAFFRIEGPTPDFISLIKRNRQNSFNTQVEDSQAKNLFWGSSYIELFFFGTSKTSVSVLQKNWKKKSTISYGCMLHACKNSWRNRLTWGLHKKDKSLTLETANNECTVYYIKSMIFSFLCSSRNQFIFRWNFIYMCSTHS